MIESKKSPISIVLVTECGVKKDDKNVRRIAGIIFSMRLQETFEGYQNRFEIFMETGKSMRSFEGKPVIWIYFGSFSKSFKSSFFNWYTSIDPSRSRIIAFADSMNKWWKEFEHNGGWVNGGWFCLKDWTKNHSLLVREKLTYLLEVLENEQMKVLHESMPRTAYNLAPKETRNKVYHIPKQTKDNAYHIPKQTKDNAYHIPTHETKDIIHRIPKHHETKNKVYQIPQSETKNNALFVPIVKRTIFTELREFIDSFEKQVNAGEMKEAEVILLLERRISKLKKETNEK